MRNEVVPTSGANIGTPAFSASGIAAARLPVAT
ncbi:Uncharacterised protein [Mycobacterium tuberculosis]|nr:Uncharacterised protein [Mycobacterium tuberculosis]